MTSQDSLTVPHAAVRYGETTLADVSDLCLAPGRPVAIVGESGSGKSVLAHALMGTLPPELSAEGTMLVGDVRFDLADPGGRRHLWGREIALLPQEPALALDPTMRIRPQVAEGAAGWRPRRAASERLAEERLAGLGLGEVAGAYPHTLSGGMAQRVAYAAATIGGARVLIVDEPSKGLDDAALERLAQLLAGHVARGGLLLTITHDLQLARRLGGDVLVMCEATVVESGPAAQVLATPAHAYTQRLVASEPSRWSFPWMHPTPAEERSGESLVSARGIAKSYGDRRIFDDISIDIRPGERWAVTGPSGVGKTTLGNALLRLTPVDRGEVRHGEATQGGRVQKLYQDPVLSFPRRVPLEHALADVMRRHDVQASRVHTMLEQVGLRRDVLRRTPGQVSGGELQRIAVVRAMLPRPVLVFADEATSRLDLASQETVVDLLMTEVAQTGCALLLVTHQHALAGALADQWIRLAAGGEDQASPALLDGPTTAALVPGRL